MPKYDYRCDHCKLTVTVYHGMNDKPPVDCILCHNQMEKVISAPNVILNGPGFYSTEGQDRRLDALEEEVNGG